jgi:hypothetical protein
MTSNAYLIFWCSEGLESVVPISKFEHVDAENTFRVLNNQDPVRNPLTGIIQMMLMRGRINCHQHYELYAITATDGITEQDIRDMFEQSPQTAADTIRRIGVKLYGTPAGVDRTVIV